MRRKILHFCTTNLLTTKYVCQILSQSVWFCRLYQKHFVVFLSVHCVDIGLTRVTEGMQYMEAAVILNLCIFGHILVACEDSLIAQNLM